MSNVQPSYPTEETAELVGGLARIYEALDALDAALTPESLSSHE